MIELLRILTHMFLGCQRSSILWGLLDVNDIRPSAANCPLKPEIGFSATLLWRPWSRKFVSTIGIVSKRSISYSSTILRGLFFFGEYFGNFHYSTQLKLTWSSNWEQEVQATALSRFLRMANSWNLVTNSILFHFQSCKGLTISIEAFCDSLDNSWTAEVQLGPGGLSLIKKNKRIVQSIFKE